MNNKPVVVWQHGRWRIVALDTVDLEHVPELVMEERFVDAMGADTWLEVDFHSCERPALLLMSQIASRIDVLPNWVRAFVHEDLKDLESDEGDDDDEEDGDSA